MWVHCTASVPKTHTYRGRDGLVIRCLRSRVHLQKLCENLGVEEHASNSGEVETGGTLRLCGQPNLLGGDPRPSWETPAPDQNNKGDVSQRTARALFSDLGYMHMCTHTYSVWALWGHLGCICQFLKCKYFHTDSNNLLQRCLYVCKGILSDSGVVTLSNHKVPSVPRTTASPHAFQASWSLNRNIDCQ